MPFRPDGSWFLNVFEKQARIVNSKARYLLVSGPRKSGKTLGIAHAVCKHCYDTDGARVSLLGATNTVNADGGAWDDLTGERGVINEWVQDGLLEWVTHPKVKGQTKKLYCEVRNVKTGHIAYIQLDSLSVEDDVSKRYKGRRFSMIWITQMEEVITSKYPFAIIRQCLRMKHLRPEEHRFIADVNPPDNGKDNWMYKLWFLQPTQAIPEDIDPEARLSREEENRELAVIEISIDDNTFLTPAERREVYSCYAHDPILLARFYYGKWVKASGLGYFANAWRPSAHVIGKQGNIPDLEHPGHFLDDDLMLLDPNCKLLLTGWDYGGSNPAVMFIEPVDVSADPDQELFLFKVHNELVLRKQNISLKDFTALVEEIQADLIQRAGRPIRWEHYSDTSSFSDKEGIEEFEARSIYRYSNERIFLQEAPKGRVLPSLNHVRRLLIEDRILVSARCERLIEALSSIALTRTGRIDPSDPHKHPLDALRYCIAAKCWHELENAIVGRSSGEEPQVVTVGM